MPAATAVTTPVMVLIVAEEGLLDDQVPPAIELDNVKVDPTHAVVTPVIGANTGKGFTTIKA